MNYETFSASAADRVDAEEYGIDPATIALILTTVLPTLMDCFMPMAQTEDEVMANVRLQYKRNARRTRRRLAYAIRRETPEKLSTRAAYALADATIDECLSRERPIYGNVDDDAGNVDDQHDGTAG